jgi:ABC-type Na+ efflux pump permease subunit
MTLTVYDSDTKSAITYNVRSGTNVLFSRPKRDVTNGNMIVDTQPRDLAMLNKGRYEVEKLQTITDPVARLSMAAKRTYIGTINVRDVRHRLGTDETRQWLLGMVILEFSVILLIVTNAAASTVTREKEDGTLDLLLSTPITSRYYIWGKLRGLVAFVLPLVAVPVFSVAVFVIVDVFKQVMGSGPADGEWMVFPEAVFVLPGTLIIVVAFASILGMQMSLRCRTTVMAVMSSIGIVVGACFALGFCGYNMVSSHQLDVMGLVFGSFSPFTLMTVMIDPKRFAESVFDNPDDWFRNRVILFLFGWGAVAAYAGLVWTMYKSMVKNFDMTIRKQSR